MTELEELPIEKTYFEYQEGITDVIIRVENRDFHVNKGVLMVASPVFFKMLTNEFKEKESGIVELKEKRSSDVEDFLKSIYPSIRIKMTDEGVDNVLPLAHEYQVSTLLADCEEYLLKKYFSNMYPYSKNPTTEKLTRFLWYGNAFGLECLQNKSVMVLALCRIDTFVHLDQYKALPSDLQSYVIMQRVTAFEYFTNDRGSNETKYLNLNLKGEGESIFGYHDKGSIWAKNIPFPSNCKWQSSPTFSLFGAPR